MSVPEQSKLCSSCSSPLIKGPVAVIAGAILPLAFAPFSIYLIAVLSPLIFFLLCYFSSPRASRWYGFLFGLGFFGVGVSWVYVAMHDFGYTSELLATFLTLGFVVFLSVFPALQAYISSRALHSLDDAQKLRLAWWMLPVFWLLFEWIRGWILTGFPWLNLGYSQVDSPLAGYAPVFGVYGISFLVVITAGLLLRLFWQTRSRSRTVSASAIALIWLGGTILSFINWTNVSGEPIQVATVQGNLLQKDKWSRDKSVIYGRLQHYSDLTDPLWGKVDLVVWPENALTIGWQSAPESYVDMLNEKATTTGTDLIVGTPYVVSHEEYYSSLVVIGKQPGQYHKRHLVPFGEYVPLESMLRGLIDFFDLPMSSFSSGGDEQPALVAAGQRLAPSICYEDAFGEELIQFLPEATLLVNGSNNAWYGNSLAPHQHLQISRMRALETGRDMIRATTTGISAMIDYRGQFIAQSPHFETHVLRATLQPRTGATPYVQWGNWPVVVLMLGGLLWAFRQIRKQ